jgi:hypothetical protein
LRLIVLTGALTLFAAAGAQAAPASPPAPARPAAKASGAPASGKPLTAAAVRTLLFDLHRALFLLQRKGHSEKYQALAKGVPPGTCYGGPATPFMKAADVLPTLEARVTGKALSCFVASYFGCRLGDWLAEAGVAAEGVAYSTYDKSKVTIVEQGPNRAVADVVESDSGDLTDGKIDYGRVGGFGQESLVTTRYELTRSPQGKWLVSARNVTFKEWECRAN